MDYLNQKAPHPSQTVMPRRGGHQPSSSGLAEPRDDNHHPPAPSQERLNETDRVKGSFQRVL